MLAGPGTARMSLPSVLRWAGAAATVLRDYLPQCDLYVLNNWRRFVMKTSSVITLALAALCVALPAFAVPWCTTPLPQWTTVSSAEGWGGGIDERYYGWKGQNAYEEQWADFQKPAGVWRVKSEVLSIIGRRDHWTTRLLPGEAGANQRITTRFVIEASSGAALELPHMQVPVRWGFYWGENLPGWDFGVVLRYQDSLNFYRVMLSASRGQLALWDATGGFLQIVPCPLTLGKPHRLEITARAAHIQASVDDQLVMDYWDRALPVPRGQAGLSAWKSRVRVEQFAVTPTAPETAPMPPHQPDFHLDSEHLLRYQLCTGVDAQENFQYETGLGMVLYDGYEPISLFVKHPPEGGFFQGAMKLKPGWRPAYYSQVGPALNYKWPTLVGDLPGAIQVEESGETLRCHFQMAGSPGALASHDLTVRYDAERGVYRYEYRVKQAFTNEQPFDLFNYQVIDPLTYNNRAPGPEVEHRWSPAEHRWWVYQGQDGGWRRMPMVDYLSEHNNPELQWGQATDFLYPDPAASPAFEVEYGWARPDGWRAGIGLCTWGYDFHHWASASPAVKLNAGDELNYAVTYTALPPAEARQRFEASRLREGLESDLDQLLVFDPRGGPLTTTTWQDPQATMVWGGDGVVDPRGGRQGRAALRMEGPGEASVMVYQYMVEQYAKRWWVRGWFKTKGVRGRGLQLQVKYAYQPQPEDTFYLGGVGDRNWTPFSFITTAPARRDASTLTFGLDGPGQVWLDAVAVSALPEEKNPQTTTFTVPAGLEPSREILIDLAMAEPPTKAVYDESRNSHALQLKGADPAVSGPEWRHEGARGYLHFTGQEAAQLTFRPVLQGLDAPPEVTQEVMAKWGVPYEGYKPIFPLKQFTYEWWMRPEKPGKDPGRMTIFQSRFNPLVSLDQLLDKEGECRLSCQNHIFCGEKIMLEHAVPYAKWTHVALTHGEGKVVLYLDGEKAAETEYDPLGPGFWMNRGGLDFGRSMAGLNQAGAGFSGDLGPFRLYARALSPEEVKQRYETGWPE